MVAATGNGPAATSFSLIHFLLTAREGGLWRDCTRRGRNSTLKRCAVALQGGVGVCPPAPPHRCWQRQNRPKWRHIIPALTPGRHCHPHRIIAGGRPRGETRRAWSGTGASCPGNRRRRLPTPAESLFHPPLHERAIAEIRAGIPQDRRAALYYTHSQPPG